MASLDLLILQKLEIQQNWNSISGFAVLQKQKISKTGISQHGICGVAILVDQHIDKNCLIHVQFYSFKDSTKENKQSKACLELLPHIGIKRNFRLKNI